MQEKFRGFWVDLILFKYYVKVAHVSAATGIQQTMQCFRFPFVRKTIVMVFRANLEGGHQNLIPTLSATQSLFVQIQLSSAFGNHLTFKTAPDGSLEQEHRNNGMVRAKRL